MSFGPELIYFWARTLNEKYTPVFIDRIEGGEHWTALKFSHSKNWLFLSWHSITNGCCIVDKEKIAPLLEDSNRADPVLFFLRKHILRSRLVYAEQACKDRILSLSFEKTLGAGFKNLLTLNLECTGSRSNMILIGENNLIKETARHVHPEINRYRSILPGIPYTPPPPFMGLELDSIDHKDLFKSLPDLKGIGAPFGRIIVQNWTKHESGKWMQLLKSVFSPDTPLSSLNLIKCKNYITVFPEILPGCEVLSGDFLEGSTIMIVGLMINKTKQQLFKQACSVLEIMIQKKSKHLNGLVKQINDSGTAETYRISGELLKANSYWLKDGITEVELESWENPPKKMRIPLDPRLTIIQNAQKYFKKYKKTSLKDPERVKVDMERLRTSIQELNEQKELLALIDDTSILREVAMDISGWMKGSRIKRSHSGKYIPPHLKLNLYKHQILVGINAKGNRYVTFQLASSNDLWFHVHEIPGAHVIVKEIEQTDPDSKSKVIEVAASLAGYYSKARDALKVQVDYTERKNVRHISGSGIAHVTYTSPNTIIVRPDLWKEYIEDKK